MCACVLIAILLSIKFNKEINLEDLIISKANDLNLDIIFRKEDEIKSERSDLE